MLATNHGLTGIALGGLLPLPIAIPVAFASHFVLDMLPHYGIDPSHRNGSKTYKFIVTLDTIVALSLAVLLIFLGQWRMEITGWVAYSPDALWVVYYFKNGRNLLFTPNNAFLRFHQKIQKYERPWGIIVELAYMAILAPIVIHLLTA